MEMDLEQSFIQFFVISELTAGYLSGSLIGPVINTELIVLRQSLARSWLDTGLIAVMFGVSNDDGTCP